MSAFKPCASRSERPSTTLGSSVAEATTVCLLEGEALGADIVCLEVKRVVEVEVGVVSRGGGAEDKGEGADASAAGGNALSLLLSIRNINTNKNVSNSDLVLS